MGTLIDILPNRRSSTARTDPYAGADMENVRRFGTLIWSVSLAAMLVLAPLFPPTDALGPAAGWLIWAAVGGGFAAYVVHVLAHPTWTRLLALNYGGAAALAVVQWLAGGWEVPYHQLFLPLVVGCAMAHPRSRFVAYLVVAVALVLLPVAYGPTAGQLDDVLTSLPLWCGLSLFASTVMTALRAQRVALADGRARAEDEARHDQLTGLENRRSFDEGFGEELAAARAAGRPLALAVGDLDRFKLVNDRHGHLAGDACLRDVAAALRRAARAGDRVFRWGGDEFAVLLAGADGAEAAAVCARIEAAVAGDVRVAGEPVGITLGWTQDDGAATPEALVATADEALLARKRMRAPAAA